ncbi:hypothetical protein EDF66_108172 [Sphingobacterium sp. JUb20]|jgi:hypothetical protein|nr:hypothetical protein EDF66_108172 [Sphingobacterium sp. JUb20]
MFHYEGLSFILDKYFIKILDMKKILSLVCFCISFFATHASSVSRDTSSAKFGTEGNKYGSKNFNLKLEPNSDERFNVVKSNSLPIDREGADLNMRGSRYKSNTPVLKIPTDPNVHYHMQHKKTDIDDAAPIPNSFKNAIPLGDSGNSKLENNPVQPLYKLEFLPDSLMHRHDSPLKRNGYKAK